MPRHPHILPLHDSGQADVFLYYVTPFVEGESLREKLNRVKQPAVEESIEITRGVAAAHDLARRAFGATVTIGGLVFRTLLVFALGFFATPLQAQWTNRYQRVEGYSWLLTPQLSYRCRVHVC